MTLEQYIHICKTAIAANLRTRNTRVFDNAVRQCRLAQNRRQLIRRWIAQLRLATDPITAPSIAERVRWQVN